MSETESGNQVDKYLFYKLGKNLDASTKLYSIVSNPNGANLSAVRAALEARGYVENIWEPTGPHFDLKWGARKRIDFNCLESHQWVNHFERDFELTTKAGLAANMKNASLWEADPESFVPLSFHCNGSAAIEEFATEFKVAKASCILKAWLGHIDAGGVQGQTFHTGVVCKALAVVKRRYQDIDMLLDKEDDEAEQLSFEILDDEWEVLQEVNFDFPEKVNEALENQLRRKADLQRSKQLTKLATDRNIAQLNLHSQRLNLLKEESRRQLEEKETRRQLLRERVLRQCAAIKTHTDCVQSSSPSAQSSPAGSFSPGLAASLGRPSPEIPFPKMRTAETTRSRSMPALLKDELARSRNCLPKLMARVVEDELDRRNPEAKMGQAAGLIADNDELSGEELVAAVREVVATQKSVDRQYDLCSRNIWIMKPSGKLRGQGIFLEDNLDQICKAAHRMKGAGADLSYVCQKYIENPLLLGGTRKHDIRQWVAVTSLNPLTIWFFNECYVRLAANDYALDNIHDQFAHLNNNAIICHHELYDPEDEYWRCQWDQKTYSKLLQDRFGSDVFAERILPAMKRQVIASVSCVQEALAEPPSNSGSFQLFGYDFMVDASLNVWLIEVNDNPLMHASCPVTERLCDVCLEDLIRVTLEGEGSCAKALSPLRFELLHKGPQIGELPKEGVHCIPQVVGRSVARPRPPDRAMSDWSGEWERIQTKNAQELRNVAERRRLKEEKEKHQRLKRYGITDSIPKWARRLV